MNCKALVTALVIGLLAVSLSACQSTRRTLNFDTSVEIDFNAYEDANPDADDRASPVVLRVFHLADDRQFEREDFLNLYENAEQRLGKDLLNTTILKEFSPGEQRIETLSLSPEVKYIGVLAEFFQYQNTTAVITLPIVDHSGNVLDIHIVGNKLLSSQLGYIAPSTDEEDASTGSRNTRHNSKYKH